MKYYSSKSNAGYSLIEALVATTIMLIAVLALSSMFAQQRKEIQRLTVKSNLLDIQNATRRTLSDPAKCLYNMNSAAITVNNSSAAALASHSISFPPAIPIRDGITAGSPSVLAYGTNTSLPETTISDIRLNNWRAVNPTDYLADLSIGIVSSLGPIAPIKILDISFKTAGGALAAEAITFCTAGSAASLTTGVKAWVRRLGGAITGSGIGGASGGGTPVITLNPVFANSNYVVVCNSTLGPGVEEQIYAYSKTPSQFQLRAAHGSGADPVGNFDCIIVGD